MPANLTPDYMLAEARFKAAREPTERIEALEEMLRVIPKHKGTDHLRGDLRRKLSHLREEARSGGKKGAARRADPGYVPSQGAGQVVLLGPSNTGKSSLVAALTRAEPEVAPYPYTTRKPMPAINLADTEKFFVATVELPGLEMDDIDIQLVGKQLVITGERKWEKEQKDKDFYRVESQYGTFRRAVELPEGLALDPEKVDASYAKGMLEIRIPKLEPKPATHIKVKVKK